MTINDVESILSSFGFTKTDPSSFGIRYSRQLSTGLNATAYASLEGGFLDTAKSDRVRKVDFTLDSKGTTYRCLSLVALQNNTARIVSELDRVSQTPDLLKCPECGTRYVHTKEPSAGGKQFKPFLSCEGMRIVGKGNKKHALCNGISKALPALVTYP
jgi:hypothetical protein